MKGSHIMGAGNLKYATFSNDKHNGQIKTWTNPDGVPMAQITVDGQVLFMGEVSDEDE
jgi:hypothetical protein